jgi:hypothetical protein
MEDFQQFLIKLFIDNPWMAFFLFAATLFGIISTVFFGFKSLKRKLPILEIKNSNLINNFASKYNGVKIDLNGVVCENLTSTKIIFWNKGRETVTRSNVPDLDKIKIIPKEGIRIFSAEIIRVANEINNFSLKNINNFSEIEIDFDYIDKDEGVAIQILHSGEGGENEDLIIKGSVMGFGKIRNKGVPAYFSWIRNSVIFVENIFFKSIKYLANEEGSLESIRKRYKRFLLAILTFIMPILMTIVFLFPSKPKDLSSIPVYQKLILPTLTFILYYPMGFYLIRRRIPKKLDIF